MCSLTSILANLPLSHNLQTLLNFIRLFYNVLVITPDSRDVKERCYKCDGHIRIPLSAGADVTALMFFTLESSYIFAFHICTSWITATLEARATDAVSLASISLKCRRRSVETSPISKYTSRKASLSFKCTPSYEGRGGRWKKSRFCKGDSCYRHSLILSTWT